MTDRTHFNCSNPLFLRWLPGWHGLLCGLLLLLLSGQALANTEAKVLVFGDSLSAAYGIAPEEGWVTLLAKQLERGDYPVAVANASVSGETTSGGLARLPAALQAHQPDLVVLELGGNDGLRGLPVAQMRANLQEMIELSLDNGAEVLLIGIQIPPNYGPRYTEPFYAQYQELADAYDLALLPFLLEGIADNPALMQNDGVHPIAAAQPMIVDNVWPVLAPLLPAPALSDET